MSKIERPAETRAVSTSASGLGCATLESLISMFFALAFVAGSAWIAVGCSEAGEPAPSPEAAGSSDSGNAARDSSVGADAGAKDEDGSTSADVSKSADAPDGAVVASDDAAGHDAPTTLDCSDAGDIQVTCAQGAPCNCSSECSTSEGTGPFACALLCSCNNAESTGAFQCSQDCPPDASPPTDCHQGVGCVPGVECGGDPPVCLCDNTGHLQCPPGFDGGA
jgi:hypothetical protein